MYKKPLQMYKKKLDENVREKLEENVQETLANVRERENGRKCTRKPCTCTRKKWKKMCEKPFQMYEKNQRNCTRNWVPELCCTGAPCVSQVVCARTIILSKKVMRMRVLKNILKPVDLWCHYCTKYEAQPIDKKHCLGFGLPVSNLGSFSLSKNEIRMRV